MESQHGREQRLRELASEHARGLLILNREAQVVFADAAAETFFNKKSGALAGQTLMTLLAAGDGADIRLNAGAGGMRISEIEWEGKPHYLATLRGSVEMPNGELRHRDIVMALPDLIFVYRGDRIVYVNDAGVKLLRATSPDQIIGRSVMDFVPPDAHTSVQARTAELSRSPGPLPPIERKIVALDGTHIDVEVRPSAFLADGEMNFQVICRDITDQKAAERALLTSTTRFRQLAEAMPFIVWTANPGEGLDYASRAFTDTTGPTVKPLGLAWLETLHPDDIPGAIAARMEGERLEKPFTMEFRVRRFSDGQYRWHFSNAMPVHDENGKLVKWFGSAIDVHDRKTAEEEAQALAARLTTTLESITDAFYTLDRDWRFVYVNNEAERLLRRARKDLVGKVLWEEFPGAVGTMIESQLKSAMADGRAVAFQEFAPTLKIWVDTRAYPSSDGLTVYFRDITEQRDMESRLRQAQRLEAIGQLTGGIAHDFNNLLTVIIGNAEMMGLRLPDNDPLRPLAELTLAAAERGSDLTHRLLAFARKQALEPKAVDVNLLLGNMDALLKRTLGEQIELRWVGARRLCKAFIDASQLEGAVLNLCINARDAMPKGGHITIETANVALDEAYANKHLEVVPGEYVMVAVSDTGTGMTPDVVAQAFEPFFTTKGQGSGLGLSMVHGFVKQSGGHVKIYTELGHGTTVKLYLPRALDGAVAAPRAVDTPITGGHEKVLLVEDDDYVREFAAVQLKDLGYKVTVARDGNEALAIIKQTPDFDLLFTDVVMPGGMKGPELAAASRKINPALRVLYTSGYTENAIVHHGRLDPGIHLLNKPYRRHDLALKLRQALDEKPLH
ncbi:MAG: PAS domain S-box protein [Alphaproteobacteria bacterium]|nr:PAS domain S-box protein [Alphaproteobacteria bacterium]